MKKGEVEMESNKKKIILRAPNILGTGKYDYQKQSAKCLTDTCIAYVLKRETFEKIIKKDSYESQFKFREFDNILMSEYIKSKFHFEGEKEGRKSSLHLSDLKRGNLIQ